MDDDDMGSHSPPPSPSDDYHEIEEDFIIVLETLPELWNIKHEDYRKRYKRDAAHKKLLEIYKFMKPRATLEDVKKKNNSLRSNYRRELKKIAASKRSGAGAEDVYTPKSKSFKLLSFLYDTEKSENSQKDSRREEADTNQNNNKENIDELERSLPGPSLSSINPISPNTPKQIKKPKSLEAKQSELLDRANLFLSHTNTTLQSQQRVQETTISDSLAFVWAKKLDKLNPQQRLFAEKAINDILFEADLGNLHRFSVKINENSPVSRFSLSTSPTNVINPPTPSPTDSSLYSSSTLMPFASPSTSLDTALSPSHAQYSLAGPVQTPKKSPIYLKSPSSPSPPTFHTSSKQQNIPSTITSKPFRYIQKKSSINLRNPSPPTFHTSSLKQNIYSTSTSTPIKLVPKRTPIIQMQKNVPSPIAKKPIIIKSISNVKPQQSINLPNPMQGHSELSIPETRLEESQGAQFLDLQSERSQQEQGCLQSIMQGSDLGFSISETETLEDRQAAQFLDLQSEGSQQSNLQSPMQGCPELSISESYNSLDLQSGNSQEGNIQNSFIEEFLKFNKEKLE